MCPGVGGARDMVNFSLFAVNDEQIPSEPENRCL